MKVSGPLELDKRKQTILKAIVDDYVETAEPVGSKALLSRHPLKLSPATVRNVMAELEELGFLEQPHTSAGRIPSDKGYRAYVDQLMQLDEIPQEQAEAIRQAMRDNLNAVSELISKAAGVLAHQTQFASLVLSPRYGNSSLRQIKILMIEPGRALVVVVLSEGVVKDRMVRVPNLLDAAQLNQIAEAIEKGLAGTRVDDITLVTLYAAGSTASLPESLLNQVLFEAYVSIKQADNLELYMEGAHSLLSQPEFSDVRKAHRFLDTLHQNKLVAGYMSEIKHPEEATDQALAPKRPAYMVRIGQEVALEGFEDLSFITTTYRMGDCITGTIGVIGPKRMPYNNIISQISFVNQVLNDEIRSLSGQAEPQEEK